MKRFWTRIVACAAICGALPDANADPLDPAKFWISASNVSPISQEAPNINAAVDRERKLYIWAQPPTDESGNFKKLQSFSLNLVIPQQLVGSVAPVVDFLDGLGKIKVYNPPFNATSRFEYVFDSTPSPPYNESLTSIVTHQQVLDGTPDGIGMPDPSDLSGHDFQGFSIATGAYSGIAPDPLTGGCYDNDLCAMTNNNRPAWLVAEVAFQTVRPGVSNPYFLQIGYNGMTHQEGQSSAATKVVFGANGGPTYDSGLQDSNHHLVQRQVTLPGDSFDVQITGVDFSPGDFDRNGFIGPEDYQHWRSSFGQSVTPGAGADGNGDGVINAADYVIWRKNLVTPRMPGDYDGNGTIGPGDYGSWRSSFGQGVTPGTEADGNGDGVIDAADYVVWRKALAQTGAGASASFGSPSSNVPEPASLLLVITACVGGRLVSQRDRASR